MKINKISPQDSKYLQIIANIAKCPQKLYFIGKVPSTRIVTVAIVGSRKPTSYGEETTYRLAYELAKRGIVVVSGLAYGVDSIAHRATLEAGGLTLAVLAGGLDDIYPASHRKLASKIVDQGGALISEYPVGTEPKGWRFLERNRLISGLADAVILTEATEKSGTMSTVMHALDQGKNVFVVPGNITSPLSIGCNRLIKQGAHPITCVEDVLEIIAPDLLRPQAILPLGDSKLETDIIRILQAGVRDGEEIQLQSGANSSDFSITLTNMEISGTIRALGGNRWTLR